MFKIVDLSVTARCFSNGNKKPQDAELNGKKVFLRVDFNVAVENGQAKEKFKIEVCKDTVEYLLKKRAKVALVSHLGRPEGKRIKIFRSDSFRMRFRKFSARELCLFPTV